MKLNYRNDLFRELRDELVEATSQEERMAHVARAEQLLADLDNGHEAPFGYYHYRITNALASNAPAAPILAADARHDVRKLVEEVWDSANVPIESAQERVLTIDDLTRMFNVSAKTISRWRDRGLVGRRYLVGGRKQLGFPMSAVEQFIRQNPERIRRGSSFSQLSEGEKAEIIDLARQLAAEGDSAKSVLSRVASRTGRSIETVRYTIKRHDQKNPKDAVLTAGDMQREEQHDRIYAAYLSGVSLARIARKFRCDKAQIQRVIRETRLSRIMELPLEYMANDEFEHADAAKVILAPLPEAEYKSRRARPPADLPAYLASLYEVPLLTREQERHLFRKYNFLKYQASKLREGLNATRPSAKVLAEIERLYDEAVVVKNDIIKANLRLVVSVAKKYVTTDVTLFELISDGNISLIKAVEKFDYGLGNKFSTYATWAIKKNFARTFSTHLKRQERFRTSQDELLSSQAGYRADPIARESAQNQYENAVSSILKRLNDRERSVIQRRFGLAAGDEPRTLKEVGEEFGVSKERIRQIEARAITKLREAARDEHVELIA